MNRRAAIEMGLAAVGGALIVCAAAATQPWLDRHFLPSFVIDRPLYVRIEAAVRVATGAIGVMLAMIARRRLAAAIARDPRLVVSSLAAILLALGASEVVLRHLHVPPAEWLFHEEEPRRQADDRLGWRLVPSRIGHLTIGGRAIEYAIDARGYRARRPDEPGDPSRPTIVFAGESLIFGEGLTFDESIPAQVTAMTGIPTANLGVNGYSNDQAFLRLEEELPRFRHPVGVVSIFMPMLFGRNLDDDRPHLGPRLTWAPAAHHARLFSLARLFVPYRSADEIARGVTLTRDVMRATADFARARGARPVLVVPQLGVEDPTEAALRHRVLDEGGIPYVPVPLDASWTVAAADRHPDARGARAIAEAIAAVYQSTMPSAPPRSSHDERPPGVKDGRDRLSRLRAVGVAGARRPGAGALQPWPRRASPGVRPVVSPALACQADAAADELDPVAHASHTRPVRRRRSGQRALGPSQRRARRDPTGQHGRDRRLGIADRREQARLQREPCG